MLTENHPPNKHNTIPYSIDDEYGVMSCSGILADILPFGPYTAGMLPNKGYSNWVAIEQLSNGKIRYKRANYWMGCFEYYTGEKFDL